MQCPDALSPCREPQACFPGRGWLQRLWDGNASLAQQLRHCLVSWRWRKVETLSDQLHGHIQVLKHKSQEGSLPQSQEYPCDSQQLCCSSAGTHSERVLSAHQGKPNWIKRCARRRGNISHPFASSQPRSSARLLPPAASTAANPALLHPCNLGIPWNRASALPRRLGAPGRAPCSHVGDTVLCKVCSIAEGCLRCC